MPKAPKIRFHRKGIDPGAAGVKAWIAQWYEEPADFLIREVLVECPRPERLEVLRKSKAYRAASQRNESPLHSFLKFVAWMYLDAMKSSRRKPQFEVQMYFPFLDLQKGIRFAGNTFDPSKAQVIEKGRRDVFCSYGDMISADVYVNGCSVEVGFTQQYNLCMPLLEGLVEKSMWLPFPKKVSPQEFDPMTGSIQSIVAYEIAPSPSSNF